MRLIRRHTSMLAAAALTVCGGTAVIHGSGERGVPLTDRVNGAQKVIVATATSVNARWQENAHGDRLIVSRFVLQVEEVLKGSADGAVAMDLDGGTLDGLTLRVSDLPVLQPGERAVFFLDASGDAVNRPHRRGQGILKLDEQSVVRGSSLRLDEIRRIARASGK